MLEKEGQREQVADQKRLETLSTVPWEIQDLLSLEL